jgi:predicted amidohydrolase
MMLVGSSPLRSLLVPLVGLLLVLLLSCEATVRFTSPVQSRTDPSRATPPSPIRYRAAVVEGFPILPWSEGAWNGTAASATALMLRNVELVDRWAARASAAGADIVVFPEEFVSSFGGGGRHWQSRYTTPGLFSVRLPEHVPAQLCDAEDADVSVVGRALACVAKRRGLVVVVGLGIVAPCEPRSEPFSMRVMPCNPRTGIGFFDGVAAFGPDGTLLGSHRRMHLGTTWSGDSEAWTEASAWTARPGVATFMAPFGVRFGLLVDSDLNFGGA